jgi:hypothetical protein
MECHLEIQHSLDREKIEHAASNCAACHPNHHQEQINMLRGLGGKSIPAQTNGMLTVRVECRTCHRTKEVSATGTVLWKASAEACTACHEASAAPKLESYRTALEAALKEMEATHQRIREALKAAALPEDEAAKVTAQLGTVQHDLEFLRAANGVHNIHYATTLTTALRDRLQELCRELKIAEPKIVLPTVEDFR